MLNEMNKMKRLLSFLTFCFCDREYLAGGQLQWDVQQWLSPPDPSMNQNFVSKARHSGTAAWFFETDALAEWKASGSLLWVYGKRMFFKLPTSALQ